MNTAILPAQRKLIPDAVLGMLFLVSAEIMFFSGLISAYIINRSGVVDWPPLNQPRLPILMTGINTFVLALSGVFMALAVKKSAGAPKSAENWLKASALLGLTFLLVQGTEWSNMLAAGMHTNSSVFGAFFYTIIGAHGVHVLAGLLMLIYALIKNRMEPVGQNPNRLVAISVYWYFVVAVWPVLYVLLYFN